ncbi:hypothetical protein MXAN_7256 [Myxococcus xanthus DK 1622]|uniref:Uncharacterized protein n=1 Tax=Myxococcus xanthus (strain DK1622) TaxID=246197 RepID=Q1CW54_MYXXD|nr:hypothetical protein MXAN_7256 [Myxococcus xanthus DK 1622]NOJ51706.1 hypothetical protein [Myxococcus xanthus]QVW68588.1 hypothetical protein JTM82_03230 [Myxococcus xanthus DZ2]QPM79508.1 hypothetical protein I5Q59_35700 [Myxococcus xanthus]QZZ54857.1 hypothetical protein MyxoNM_37030 [Myxococcus xanthus]
MNIHWGSILLVGWLMMGCATPRIVRLDTGAGAPIVYTPPKRVEPIVVDSGAFQKAMTRLVLEMRFSLRSEEEVRPRVHLASWGSESRPQGRDYGAWCAQQDNPGECLSLLEDGFTFLDAKMRRKMALSFAWDGVWEGVEEAVKEVVNPLVLKAMITSAMAAYMVLVVVPEPVTKLVAIALTTYVIAYIGLDAFSNLVKGWQRLSSDTKHAVSFEQLEDAGYHFGRVMGANGARVLILALTAALGGGAANMASKGPMLPGFARAALATETNAGIQLSAAMSGGVRSISLAEGILTVGVVPNAVAATALNPAGGIPRETRIEELASDPAQGGKVTPKTRREAEVGLQLEERRQLPAPIKRDPTGQSEFVDSQGIKWDIKTFDSRFPPRKGGFSLERDLDKIKAELARGENVILNTENMSAQHVQALRNAIDALGPSVSSRILWFP